MRLRSMIAVVSAVAMVMAQMPPGFAQNAGASATPQPVAFTRLQESVNRAAPSAAIVDAFKAFPKGGDLLSKRISDIIVKDPKLAPGLVKYVQTAVLSKEQRAAAEQGLAQALERLGIKAADMPVKAPPPVAEQPFCWLCLLALLIIPCIPLCRPEDHPVTQGVPPRSTSDL